MNNKIDIILTEIHQNFSNIYDNINKLTEIINKNIPVEDCDRHYKELKILRRVAFNINEMADDVLQLEPKLEKI